MQAQTLSTITIIPPAPRTFDRGQPAFIEASPTHILYYNANTVVLKAINGGGVLYVNHNCDVKAVKFSHGYQFVASIDEKGTLMIHQVLEKKLCEHKVFANLYQGANAMDWSADNKRICIVGSSKNKYGKVISADMGTDTGQITGVTANLTAASFRPERPYKLAVGGDEKIIKYYDGPPYKFSSSVSSHTNFINQIKYCPDGTKIVSVSSDRKIVVYDGKSGEIIAETANAHEAGITGVQWLTAEQFVTVSSDKTIRKWKYEQKSLQQISKASITDVEEQLKLVDSFITAVSSCKQSDKIYCLCLSGQIREISKDLSSGFKSTFEGHKRKPIKILPHPKESNRAIMIQSNGKVLSFNIDNGIMERFMRNQLTYNSNLQDACLCSSGKYLYVLNSEMVVAVVDISTGKLIQKVAVSSSSYLCQIPCEGFMSVGRQIVEVYGKKGDKMDKIYELKTGIEATSIQFLNNQKKLYMIGDGRGIVHIFELTMGENLLMKKVCELQHTSYKVAIIAKSSDNIVLVGDSMGSIKVYSITCSNNGEVLAENINNSMGSHTTMITQIISYKDKIYTMAMDNKLSLWNPEKYQRIHTFDNVHKGGILGGIIIADKLITLGGQGLVKINSLP